jgi:hypothetical protein
MENGFDSLLNGEGQITTAIQERSIIQNGRLRQLRPRRAPQNRLLRGYECNGDVMSAMIGPTGRGPLRQITESCTGDDLVCRRSVDSQGLGATGAAARATQVSGIAGGRLHDDFEASRSSDHGGFDIDR